MAALIVACTSSSVRRRASVSSSTLGSCDLLRHSDRCFAQKPRNPPGGTAGVPVGIWVHASAGEGAARLPMLSNEAQRKSASLVGFIGTSGAGYSLRRRLISNEI